MYTIYDELIKRYKNNDYHTIESENELEDKYWNAKKGVMCVLNNSKEYNVVKIYVAVGYNYEWKIYEYNKKYNIITPKVSFDLDGHIEWGDEFPPSERVMNEIKQKNELLLTEDEKAALRYDKNTTIWVVAFLAIWALILGINLYNIILKYL